MENSSTPRGISAQYLHEIAREDSELDITNMGWYPAPSLQVPRELWTLWKWLGPTWEPINVDKFDKTRGSPDPEGYDANMSSITSKWGGIPSVKIETQPENPGPTVVPVYWWQLWPLLIFGWCVSCDYLSWLDLDTVEKALVTSQMTIMNGATWGCHWTWSGSCSKAKQDDLVDHQAQQVGSPVLNCPGLPHCQNDCHEILSTTASSSSGEGVFWPLSPGKGSSLALRLLESVTTLGLP